MAQTRMLLIAASIGEVCCPDSGGGAKSRRGRDQRGAGSDSGGVASVRVDILEGGEPKVGAP